MWAVLFFGFVRHVLTAENEEGALQKCLHMCHKRVA